MFFQQVKNVKAKISNECQMTNSKEFVVPDVKNKIFRQS